MLSRALALLLAVALFATIATSAQCVVQCANPVVPPKCHHHAPEKPAQCATAMLPSESRASVAPAIVTAVTSPLAITAIAAPQPAPLEPAATHSPHLDPPSVLRI